jgi:hypothetical protein
MPNLSEKEGLMFIDLIFVFGIESIVRAIKPAVEVRSANRVEVYVEFPQRQRRSFNSRYAQTKVFRSATAILHSGDSPARRTR